MSNPFDRNPYRIPPPWNPGYANPQNVDDEGLERRAFTTSWAPRGSFDNPMGPDDIRAKFRENASMVVSSGRIEQIIEIVDRLESLQDVKELVSLCVR